MRTIIRSFLVLAVLAVAALVMLGYWPDLSQRSADDRPASDIGTTGAIATEKARERGAELGEKAAIATEKIRESAHEASITAKIKAKMALDDSVKSRAIDVTTDGSTVTLTGKVGSASEHARAAALARETAGVTRVVDRLVTQAR